MSRGARDLLSLLAGMLLALALFVTPQSQEFAALLELSAVGFLFASMAVKDNPGEAESKFADFLRALVEPRSWSELESEVGRGQLQYYMRKAQKLGLVTKRERDGRWVLTPRGADWLGASPLQRTVMRLKLALRAIL